MKATQLIITCILILMCYGLYGQSYEAAVAYPIEGIKIDGDLKEWPQSLKTYPINQLAFGDITEENDLKGFFKIAYQAKKNILYLGVEVVDSDIQTPADANNIDLTDHMYLYLDPTHSPEGGSRMLFIAGAKQRDYAPAHAKTWSPYTPKLDWEDVNLAIKQKGATTTYEWAINLGDNFQTNSVIGLDIILVDHDSKDEGNSWMLWKPGTGKSDGYQRLGEVYLADDRVKLGSLAGKIVIKDTLVKSFNSLNVQSSENPNFWLRTQVDQNGNFQCQLPPGTYKLKPDVL
ncbi:MAG: sugar-binding protein, partial [Bacteroidota bacterium]